MKQISLVIVNYNGKKFLKRLFDSIENQTYQDFEVIFVDNSSKDDSVDFVRNNYPKTLIIHSDNNGYGFSCNAGARKSSGKYLAFFNEDMYLPHDFLEKMISFEKSLADSGKEKIGSISCKIIDFDADPEKIPPKYGAQMDIFGFTANKHFKDDIFLTSGCPFFISRKLYLRVKGFNENIFLYGEDLDLSWRLKIFGYSHYMNQNACIFHYGGGVTGHFGPEKVANVLCSSFIPIITNYGIISLAVVIPLYFTYMLSICLFLFVFKKFDFRYVCAVFVKYGIFFKKFRNIIRFRKFVQKNRTEGDMKILKYISIIPAFISNFSYKKLDKNYKQENY